MYACIVYLEGTHICHCCKLVMCNNMASVLVLGHSGYWPVVRVTGTIMVVRCQNDWVTGTIMMVGCQND